MSIFKKVLAQWTTLNLRLKFLFYFSHLTTFDAKSRYFLPLNKTKSNFPKMWEKQRTLKNYFCLHIFSLTLSIEAFGISKKMVSHTVFIQTVAYLMIQDENFTN